MRAGESIDLGVAVCTFNNERTVEATLTSVRDLAARIIVVDSGSTDQTIAICERHDAEVIHRPWPGPTLQKQYAMDQCDNEWVLLLDSDEAPDDEQRAAIRQTVERDDPTYAGWEINRKIWFEGAWVHHVYQPEWRLRLVRRGRYQVLGIGPEGRGGHDRVEVDGKVGRLPGVCRHDSWASIAEVFRRNAGLAERAAEYQDHGGGLANLLTSPAGAFLKQYLLKRGFLDGWRGLVLSSAAAEATWLKHLFIRHRKWRTKSDS